MDEPYLAGIDLLAALGSTQDERRNRAAEIAPDFVHLAVSVTYGEILGRPALDLRTRLAVSIAVLVATRGPTATLRHLVAAAAEAGCTRSELAEIVIQTAAFGDMSRSLEALAECHDLLAERTSADQACCEDDPGTGQA